MKNLRTTTLSLLNYCRVNNWEGYDPYDALNSAVFRVFPFLDARWPRLVSTQILRRIPFNIRPVLFIPKTQNSKAMGIFLKSLLRLRRLGLLDEKELATSMIDKLEVLRSPDFSNYCWGYSFPWQTRTDIIRRGTPNLVCTTFVADALLETYEDTQEARCLDMAYSAAEYIADELFWMENENAAGFSYPVPNLHTRVHNANLLASAFLSRIHEHTGEKKFLDTALAAARYAVSKQNADGSWFYGELPTQKWIDNFHTGYNLCALRTLDQSIGTSEFRPSIQRGLSFYREHLFNKNGAPKYFHDRPYPIDIHSVAQSIITLVDLEYLDETNIDLANSIFTWAMHNMWDERGYFYYRVFPLFKSKISYMRWSQAWMLLAMSELLASSSTDT